MRPGGKSFSCLFLYIHTHASRLRPRYVNQIFTESTLAKMTLPPVDSRKDPRMLVRLAAFILVFAIAACSTTPDRTIGRGSGTPGAFKVGSPYSVNSVTYVPKEDYDYSETGIASWYGPDFEGRPTANGETFDPNELTAAHPTLPMPSLVRVTNIDNGRSVVVRINDRGPFANGRVIDVSRRAAQLLAFEDIGTARVRVDIMPIESRAIADAARQRGYIAQPTRVASSVRTHETTILPVAADQSGPEVKTAALDKVEAAPLDTPVDSAPLDAPAMASVTADDQPPSGTIDAPQAAASADDALAPVGMIASAPDIPQANAGKYDYAYGKEEEYSKPLAEPPARLKAKTADQVTIPNPPKVSAFVKNTKIAAPKVNHAEANGGKRIFIQAGSFTVKENASRLKKQLATIAPTQVSEATVKGRKFYRVRLGPIKSVNDADRILARVIPRDNTAHITVE